MEKYFRPIPAQKRLGRSQYLPLYNHAWTDGRGNYCLKDVDDGTLPVDNPTEWRRLKIVNRNRPDYRPPP